MTINHTHALLIKGLKAECHCHAIPDEQHQLNLGLPAKTINMHSDDHCASKRPLHNPLQYNCNIPKKHELWFKVDCQSWLRGDSNWFRIGDSWWFKHNSKIQNKPQNQARVFFSGEKSIVTFVPVLGPPKCYNVKLFTHLHTRPCAQMDCENLIWESSKA